ncbi:MAG: YdeI/OmpD-associated family protein [Planctomycetota bacterium]
MDYEFNFKATIKKHKFGRYGYTVVYLPQELKSQLPFDKYPRLRVRGEYCGLPFENAWQPSGGKHFLIISKKKMKQCGLKVGDPLWVDFEVMDQDFVQLPPELERAVFARARLEKKWKELTPGKKRGFAFWVDSAKRPQTRQQRVDDVVEMVQAGEYFETSGRTWKRKPRPRKSK